MLAYGIASAIADATRGLWPASMVTHGFAIAAMVNIVVFAALAVVWYFKSSRRAYVVGLLSGLVLYLFWSVIIAPPTGCVGI